LICPAEKPKPILKPLPFCLPFKGGLNRKFSFYPTNPKGIIRKIEIPVHVFPRLARKERAREKIQKRLPWNLKEKLPCAEPLSIINFVKQKFSSSFVTRYI